MIQRNFQKKKREALYDEIMERAVATESVLLSPARIDEINILQALMRPSVWQSAI